MPLRNQSFFFLFWFYVILYVFTHRFSIFILLGEPESGKNKPYLARFKNWDFKCYGKRARSVCVIGVGDLYYLLDGPELFVNKFHQDFEPIAQDCLEELIYNRTALASQLRHSFPYEKWTNLSFVLNKVI